MMQQNFGAGLAGEQRSAVEKLSLSKKDTPVQGERANHTVAAW